MPDGYVEIIFYFGSECSASYNGNLQLLSSPFMVGLLNQPIIFHTKKCLEIIGIRCFPWTVFDLFALPPVNDGVRIFEHSIAELQPILSEQIRVNKIDKALALLKQYFLNANYKIAIDSMLFKAGTAMNKANRAMPVSQIAAAAHTTIRTLERKFKHSSGYTVKGVSSLMRFEQVRNQLLLYPNSNIAGLAHKLGYTDQSHLSREFKRYSGTTPAAFVQRQRDEGKT